MTPQQAAAEIKRRLAEIERFRTEDLPEIIGVEAVRHYNESFVKEGATDRSFQKWPDVKRRDPQSPWYGFSLGANTPKPKADENGMRAKNSRAKATNFSPTRAQDKILTGESNELKNATDYIIKADRVTIVNDKPYARVHNFGEGSMIFGRKAFLQKARPFIYPSAVLNKAIYNKVSREMKSQGIIK